MTHDGVYVWPSEEQQLLLEAGLLDGQRAIDAFHAWRSRVKLEDDFSPATARLLPLAYENLHRLGVDDPIMQRLKGVYRHTWYSTNRLLHAAAPVVSTLVEKDIPVLITKGVPLALAYYRNLALRPMADVDVVVPEPFLEKALGILKAQGWRGPWPELEVRRFRHAIGWVGPKGQEFDIHWRPMYESRADAAGDSFFSSSEALDFNGTLVRQPDPTHALFLTVVHGVRFNPETPVRWIPDAVTILRVRGADVDWAKIEALAVSYRVVQRLHLGLSYLARSFDMAVPPEVLDRLRATRKTLFERFESRVVLADDGSLNPSTIRNQLSWLAEYARHTPARNPLSFAIGYTHYMRQKLGLSGRRELLGRIMQGVKRKIMNGQAPSNPAGSPS